MVSRESNLRAGRAAAGNGPEAGVLLWNIPGEVDDAVAAFGKREVRDLGGATWEVVELHGKGSRAGHRCAKESAVIAEGVLPHVDDEQAVRSDPPLPAAVVVGA